MAEILVALEAFALVEQVNTIYSAARHKIENASRNPQLAQNLSDLFERLVTELAPLAQQCTTNDLNFSNQHLHVFKVRIRELQTTMLNIRAKLQDKITKLNNPLYRFARALNTSEWLSELEATARSADQLVFDINACFANATLIANLTDAVRALSEPPDEQDSFQSSIQVPDNPPHVLLNFNSISDMEGHPSVPLTFEAQLKQAVLRSDGSQSIGAVGSSLAGGVGMRGMSGVGKSCALRGLAQDIHVSRRFRDGIYFILLGKDATEADVVQKVAEIMKASGPKRMATEAREGKTIDDAVSKAKQWFGGRCILLLIDDVWEENDSRRDIVTRLSRVADIQSGSRVVFTTRDVRIVARSEVICFSARGAGDSRRILIAVAGLHAEDIQEFGATVDEVLGYCGGIPMALAVAGSAIKMRLLSAADGTSLRDVWEEYVSGLRKCRQRLVKLTVDNDPYMNLESAFRASLLMLDKNRTRNLVFHCMIPFVVMYRALVVLRRQGWIPLNVLNGLWETADYETIDVMQELVRASLAQREDHKVDGRRVPGITLHDLQLDFVQAECREHREFEMWHRKLLSNWLPEEGSNSNRTFIPCRAWSKDDVFKKEYLRNNVCRHLMAAELRDELHRLLTNPEWVAKRLRGSEILSLEEDFRILLEHLIQANGSDTERGSAVWSLRMIAGAAGLSAPYVSRNASEVWFQLYARLLHRSEESEAIRIFLADIERHAERPWVKALTPCLFEAGGVLQTNELCSGCLVNILELDDGERTIACGIDNACAAFVSSIVKGEMEETIWLSMCEENARGLGEGTSTTECHTAPSNRASSAKQSSSDESSVSSSHTHSKNVTICCTRDGTLAITGHEDGTLQVWNAKTGEAIGMAFGADSGPVRCVAWSPDSTLVASGATDSTLRLWDVGKGEEADKVLRGHEGPLHCVAWSPDGTHVASGGYDGTVRVWCLENGAAIGDGLRGHSGCVLCVAWSTDGRRVASGAGDGTVRIWNVETMESIGEVLREHVGSVWCVAWSRDGRRIASGECNGTVRVWDLEKDKVVWDSPRGHSWSVQCLAWSSDGRRVTSGAADGTVRVWDVQKKETFGEAQLKHFGCVKCVEWSADGQHVASGGCDATVRVWDVEKRNVVGEVLFGHEKPVLRVAWSSDGTRVASGSEDETVRLWEVETGECVETEDGWCCCDSARLQFHLGEEDAVSEEHEEGAKVRFENDSSVVYCSADEETVLATLEVRVCWSYSEASRTIAAGRQNGAVDFLKLVE